MKAFLAALCLVHFPLHARVYVTVGADENSLIVRNGPIIDGPGKKYAPAASETHVAFEFTEGKGEQVKIFELATRQEQIVSSAADGTPGNFFSHRPAFSLDGKKVYFHSNSSNLIPNGDRHYRIYEKTLANGAIRNLATNSQGVNADAASFNVRPCGPDHIVFESAASNLAPGASGYNVFRKHTTTGKVDLVSSGLKESSGMSSCNPEGTNVIFTTNTGLYVRNLSAKNPRLLVRGFVTFACASGLASYSHVEGRELKYGQILFDSDDEPTEMEAGTDWCPVNY